ncbi:hypothetical protein I3843_01G292800 [Carya illinoinensis]|uniref:Autophagy-related protein 27 n=2 Tax=Carya illinoinensis TaxID=32201 RepID=A0A8T1RVD7_CARIL|nr:uncharacterized protein LOC122292285 isoform X1 [Carya illinoinensis]KAG2730549.1 hypothetical protein I3760_01G299000 [Carya illinoinensis]KAG6670292.1 hypothetical protein CIPAW_01G301500 [Carya illinoinensis]KAG7999149.1 hypothetical protein I3843_01G292800 [Carya illinoinensis]
MIIVFDSLKGLISFTFILSTILYRVASLNSVSPVCELSVIDNYKLYNYSLATPIPEFPHGVLSEDGFYKAAVNETVVWFQLCDGMIFNHDLPKCVDCWDCGGPSRCGMDCSALVVNNRGGYHVCTTIGHASSTDIKIIDKKNPHAGVIVKMSKTGAELNCSLSVSVICDSNAFQGPNSLEKLGTCDYATMMRHPSGCAKIVQFHGKGWGWFGTFITIVLCLFGGYFLAGTIYRYFFLGVRGIDIIPNLDVWASLPQRTRSSFASMVQKVRGPSQGHRNSYSRVNF